MNPYDKKRLQKVSELTIGDTILDIGYSDQHNPFLNHSITWGFDLNPPPEKDPVYQGYFQGDAVKICEILGDKKFSTIIASEVIEHLYNPYQFLKDVQQNLQNGGRLILSTPNPLGFPVLICEFFSLKKYFYTNQHTFYFLPRWMRRMIENTGLKCDSIYPVGFWPMGNHLPGILTNISYQIIYICSKK